MTEQTLPLAAPKPSTTVMMINSEMAQRMLQTMRRNRPLSEVVVAKYAHDMQSGNWIYAGDPIRFDVDGHLIDGQHRLTALSRLGTALPMLVIKGLPTETQMVMDQGRKRSTAQQLALKNMSHATVVASGVRLHLIYSTGAMFRDRKVFDSAATTASVERWIAEHAELVATLESLMSGIRRTNLLASVAYASAITLAQIDLEMTREFFYGLADGGFPLGHPINTLDKKLQHERRAGLRPTQRDQLALVFTAWNNFRDGRRITKFQRPSGSTWNSGNYPIPH